MKKLFIPTVGVLLAIIIPLFALFCGVNRAVVFEALRSDIYSHEEIHRVQKKYDCIVVFGAGIRNNSEPSAMLSDRLSAALELYHGGASDKIFISGDRSGDDYDEVSVMETYCLRGGVPAEDIIRDDFGFSTYETVYNVAQRSDVDRIIVVTQEYHIFRALYIARCMGLDADGMSSDYRSYFMQSKRDIREYFARFKDFFQIAFTSQK